MKYIKTFEDNNEYTHHILVKGASGENIFLLSVTYETDYKYYGILTYIFREGEGYKKSKHNNKNSNYDKDRINYNSLFKSENIEDCFEYMEQYANTKKYNL